MSASPRAKKWGITPSTPRGFPPLLFRFSSGQILLSSPRDRFSRPCFSLGNRQIHFSGPFHLGRFHRSCRSHCGPCVRPVRPSSHANRNPRAGPVLQQERIRGSTRRPVLLDGHQVMARPHERALLVCLHENRGFLVPYATLCAVLGYGSATEKGKHALQQHIMTVKSLLSDHDVPYAVAAISGAGYTLCAVREPEGR